jgi:hypothetical protein
VELIQADLETPDLARLYRSCDVLVHPYRGEGFAMPVLEAMACGLPVIVTGGGPTDEFCPPDAGWRIRSRRVEFPEHRIDSFATAGAPWMLEPDVDDLVTLLQEAASDRDERSARGRAGYGAAQALSWDVIAARYRDRITALAGRRPRVGVTSSDCFPFEEDVAVRVLATPAWRGSDRLAELLGEWCETTTRATSACLYLLADPAVAGTPEQIEQFVVRAAGAAGADLESCADINVLMEPMRADRDERLHRSVDAYVVLHSACAGHARLAHGAGRAVLEPGSGSLAHLLARVPLATW